MSVRVVVFVRIRLARQTPRTRSLRTTSFTCTGLASSAPSPGGSKSSCSLPTVLLGATNLVAATCPMRAV
eukprot:1849210-Pleurochrysis_carterae.AAC.1